MGRGWGGERTTIILLRHMGKPGQQKTSNRPISGKPFAIFIDLFSLLNSIIPSFFFLFTTRPMKPSSRQRWEKFRIDILKINITRIDKKKGKKRLKRRGFLTNYVPPHRPLENYAKYWEVSLIGKLINRKNYSTKQRRNFQYILESSKAATTRGQISSGCAPHCEAIVNADIMFPSITRHIRVRLSGFISDTGLTAVARWATTPRKPRFAKHFHQESLPRVTAIISPEIFMR